MASVVMRCRHRVRDPLLQHLSCASADSKNQRVVAANTKTLYWDQSTFWLVTVGAYSMLQSVGNRNVVRLQAEEEAAWAASQREAETRRLAEEERRRKVERTVRSALNAHARVVMTCCIAMHLRHVCCRIALSRAIPPPCRQTSAVMWRSSSFVRCTHVVFHTLHLCRAGRRTAAFKVPESATASAGGDRRPAVHSGTGGACAGRRRCAICADAGADPCKQSRCSGATSFCLMLCSHRMF